MVLKKEDAIYLADKDVLTETLTTKERVIFQLCEPLMSYHSFGKFHEDVESVLGRPVYTHEFADPRRLILELLNGDKNG